MKKERSDGMGDQKGSLPPLTIQTTRLPPGELSACLAIYIPTCSETVRRFWENVKKRVVMYREVKWWQQCETNSLSVSLQKNEVVMYREVKWWQQCETNSLSVGLRSDLYPDLLGNCASFLRKDKKTNSVKQIVSQSACLAIYIPTCSETVRRFCENIKNVVVMYREVKWGSVKQIVSHRWFFLFGVVVMYRESLSRLRSDLYPDLLWNCLFVKIDQSNQKRSSSPSYVQHLNSDADSKFQESSLRQQDLQDIHDADEE
ncbi:hypothetical protein J6590_084953 [Homalodisca vitripennis]|nr:hypothetical protein J6590_084953 [Homalodisca vitripennis]